MPFSATGIIKRLDPWGFIVAIFALALFCYWPALTGDILWDDPAHLTRPELRTWAGLLEIWTNPYATQQYYPVLHSAFWIEHRLWGDATIGYHLINVLQHAFCALLLAFVLRRIRSIQTAADSGALPARPATTIPTGAEWLAALLFAAHPLCVESVAWITEQKNTLSLLFYLAAAYNWLGYASTRRRSSWIIATAFFVLALGTKTATVTLPPSLLVVMWWVNGRIDWRKDILPIAPWFGLALAAGLVTAWAEHTLIGAKGEAYALTLVERTLLAGRTTWFYLQSQFWPLDRAFFHELWNVPEQASGWVINLVACIALTAALWLIRRRTRGPLAVWLLFVGSLFPVLGFFNIFPYAFSYVADHFEYIATLCFVSGAAVGLTVLVRKLPPAIRPAGIGVLAVVILTFAGLSHGLSRNYRSNETLMRASIATTPDNWMAHRVLAWAIAKEGTRDTEAIKHYEISLQLNPSSPDSHHGLGLLLARSEDRKSEAIGLFERAIELRPYFAEAHHALALELKADPDRRPEVIDHLEAALEVKPDMAPVHLELANALAQIPTRQPEAFFHYQEALRLNPSYAEAHYRLGNLLAPNKDSRPEAIAHYEAALRLEPGAAPVHYALATAYAATPGRMDKAIEHLEETVRLKPDFAEAHGNLANALATQPGRLTEAIEHYEEALRIDPGLGWAHLNLAMNLAALPDRQKDAIRHAEAGLQLEPENLEARNGLAILYVQQGEIGRAREQWETALRIDPGYETARDNLRTLNQIERGQ